ncbi:15231_t:CDS:2 [Cetraspora pellucida]|uniref:15231_t:CDS:1 n=1 Tax=Cetraspora pellucida TaxID=1433469 RepID=A0A9N8VPJ3_9GLOM|nr:15231_t:CDS:2 [Cetraspora pellucida]
MNYKFLDFMLARYIRYGKYSVLLRKQSELIKLFNICIAFGPNDLVNNAKNNDTGGDPFKFFNNQSSKFYELLNYKQQNSPNFKIILSVLLPTDGNNLTKFFNLNLNQSQVQNITINGIQHDIVSRQSLYESNSTQNMKFIDELVYIVTYFNLDGIDIDYPFKYPCIPSTGFNETDFSNFLSAIATRLGNNKKLTITAGQYPIKGINSNLISFINIQAFRLNINNTLLSPSTCPTNLIPSSQWTYGFINNAKQPYLYLQQNSSSNYYVTFYEDYQSLNAKLDYIKSNNLAGIVIADITKDSQLTNFILGNQPGKSGTPGTTPPSSPSNIGAIIDGVIGSIIVVSTLMVVGFRLYRRKQRAKMSDPLINTNNQTCSDTNPQVYFDINRQIRPDINNRIYSDTNHT